MKEKKQKICASCVLSRSKTERLLCSWCRTGIPPMTREIVLNTFHRHCYEEAEELTHECSHCGCFMRITLIRKGEEYQNLSHKLFCPFCATLFDSQMGF